MNGEDPLYLQDMQFKFGYCKVCDEDAKHIEPYFHHECGDNFHKGPGFSLHEVKMIDMKQFQEQRQEEDTNGNFNFKVSDKFAMDKVQNIVRFIFIFQLLFVYCLDQTTRI